MLFVVVVVVGAIQKRIPHLQKAPQILRGSLAEPTGPQGGGHCADLFDFTLFLGTPGAAKLMSNRPRDVPKDAQGVFEVKKTRLQKQLHAKIDLGHDFKQFWIEFY